MSDIWRVFWIKQCVHTTPPKDKWIVVVGKDRDYLGFFINKGINSYVRHRPSLLAAQVPLKESDYGFLGQDSYIDCQQVYAFDIEALVSGRGNLLAKTIADIKAVVAVSMTLEPRYVEMILRN